MANEDININRIDKVKYGMLLARVASLRSEDPYTKVGCAIFNKDFHVLSIGYNGFSPGYTFNDISKLYDECVEHKSNLDDSLVDDSVRLFKNKFAIHAEDNALRHVSVSDNPYYIFSNYSPCAHCSAKIATYGIKTVFFEQDYLKNGSEHDIDYRLIFAFYGIEWHKVNTCGDNYDTLL